MKSKRCPECGKFMKINDLIPDIDDFDEELALACGFTQEFIDSHSWMDKPLNQFCYMQDQWECQDQECGYAETWDEGPKYYYNHETNNYNAIKPRTLKELAEIERLAQEAAGQMRLEL